MSATSRLGSTVVLVLTLACSDPVLAATPAGSYTAFVANGSVIENHDGDTFKLQTPDHGILTVRFSGMDTPETGQSFWKSARRSLAGLVRGQPVTVRCYKKSHERDVCRVFAGTANLDVGLEMVRLGMAWHAFQFAHEQTEDERVAYKAAEEQARLGRVGLWSEPDPMAPWECRRLRRAGQKCRYTRVARLMEPDTGAPLDVPPLLDAQLVGLTREVMSLSGIERVEAPLILKIEDFAQTWLCWLDARDSSSN